MILGIFILCVSMLQKFYRYDGYLFRKNKLCVPNYSMRDILMHESHCAEFNGLFWVQKTYDILCEHFYWLNMRKDIEKIC